MAVKITYPFESGWSDADELLLYMNTGSWRTVRPEVNVEECNYCALCSLYCPPNCLRDKGDHFEADLEYCKGCGICARECPRKAITMVPEG
jgi:pyruvate ferredoxin oxidoreductase delta subunit